ncbi:MAG TPA: helix-turn-helix transcriptional regulator [Microlunatus sp.]|nr:helix-turn-helix transcriptional regulator [Microlunatus sp.]
MAGIKTPKLGEQLESLGEYIAAQRRVAGVTIRQLAEQAGVSNPYLSQIERGLRRPSAEVLQQLAKALRISAETLYVQAGILDPQDHPTTTVEMAVLADPSITERQKRVLIDVYTSFVHENEAKPEPITPAAAATDAAASPSRARTASRAAKTAPKTSTTTPTKEK